MPITVDWSRFPVVPQQTVECACGYRQRVNAKGVLHEGRHVIVRQHPCPNCGALEGRARRVEHDPEIFTIRS